MDAEVAATLDFSRSSKAPVYTPKQLTSCPYLSTVVQQWQFRVVEGGKRWSCTSCFSRFAGRTLKYVTYVLSYSVLSAIYLNTAKTTVPERTGGTDFAVVGRVVMPVGQY